MSYITDERISNTVFDGEPVPGPNTVSTERNESWKRRSYLELNSFMRRSADAPPVADPQGVLGMIQMRLYRKLVDGDEPELSDKDKMALVSRRHVRAPLMMHDTRR